MRYKVGDKVVIRGDLESEAWYGDADITKEMLDFRGKACTISSVRGKMYELKEDTIKWDWSEEMIDHETTAKLSSPKEEIITLTKEQALKILCYLEHSIPGREYDECERRALIDMSYDMMWAIGEKLCITPEEEYVDIKTLEVKSYMDDIEREVKEHKRLKMVDKLLKMESEMQNLKNELRQMA